MNAVDLDIAFDIQATANQQPRLKDNREAESRFQNILDNSINLENDEAYNEPKPEKAETPLAKEPAEPKDGTIKPIETATPVSNEAEESEELSGFMVVPMADMIAKLGLDEEQVEMLAEMLNITVDELRELKIEINLDAIKKLQNVYNPDNGKNPTANLLPKAGNIFNAVLKDGTKVDFTALLGLNAEETLPADANEIVEKIAKVLGISKEQAEIMAKELKLDKVEVKAVEKTGAEKIAAVGDENKSEGPFLRKDAARAKVTNESSGKAVDETAKEDSFEATAEKATGKMETGITEPAKSEAVRTVVTKIESTENTIVRPVSQNSTEFETKIKEIKEVRHAASETSTKIMNQIVEKARILSFPEHTEARLVLNPKQLGTIDIKIMVHDAQVRGQIVVENPQIKQIVEQNIDQLKSAMAGQGIELHEINVEVGSKETRQGGNEMGDEGARQFADSNSLTQSEEEMGKANRAIEVENMRKAASNSIVYLKV